MGEQWTKSWEQKPWRAFLYLNFDRHRCRRRDIQLYVCVCVCVFWAYFDSIWTKVHVNSMALLWCSSFFLLLYGNKWFHSQYLFLHKHSRTRAQRTLSHTRTHSGLISGYGDSNGCHAACCRSRCVLFMIIICLIGAYVLPCLKGHFLFHLFSP